METTTSGDLPERGRLFIPAVGDRLILTAPWKFRLFLESRNMKFAKSLAIEDPGKGRWAPGPLPKREASLPEGTVLECDRVYIRTFNKSRVQEKDDYDSITWKVMAPKAKGKAKGELRPAGRFWVKLPDCYSIEYRLEWDSLYRDRVKVVDQVHGL